jgi:hypothetical protein
VFATLDELADLEFRRSMHRLVSGRRRCYATDNLADESASRRSSYFASSTSIGWSPWSVGTACISCAMGHKTTAAVARLQALQRRTT